MHRIRFTAVALGLLSCSVASAHPGHGTTSPDSLQHYLSEPTHAAPLLLLVAAAVGLALIADWQRRRR